MNKRISRRPLLRLLFFIKNIDLHTCLFSLSNNESQNSYPQPQKKSVKRNFFGWLKYSDDLSFIPQDKRKFKHKRSEVIKNFESSRVHHHKRALRWCFLYRKPMSNGIQSSWSQCMERSFSFSCVFNGNKQFGRIFGNLRRYQIHWKTRKEKK